MKKDKRSLFWQLDFQLQESHGLGFTPSILFPWVLGEAGYLCVAGGGGGVLGGGQSHMGLVRYIGKGAVTRPLILPTRPQKIGVNDFYVLTALPGGLKYCFGFLLCFGFVSFAVVPGVKNTGSGSDSAITVWCGLKQHTFLSGPHHIACVQSGPCYITSACCCSILGSLFGTCLGSAQPHISEQVVLSPKMSSVPSPCLQFR